jgi:hypothetical protein
MKILSGISVAALLMAGVATPSFATSLAPGATVVPTLDGTANFLGPANFTILGNTGVVNYTMGDDSGTIQEWVGTWSANPVAGDNIVFVYQVHITTGDGARVTGGSYAGFNTDVFTNADGGGTTAPIDASRSSSGVVVGFDFNPNLAPGTTSYFLIVDTNANGFTSGPMSVIDDNTFTGTGFAPANTPEPSTLSLLGTGLLAAGAGLRRRMLRK